MSMAIYAGTFDPITTGHLSVVRQAAQLFSHLRILVAVNPAKRSVFTPEERVQMIRDVVRLFPNASVDHTERLVVEYAREIGATFLLRGIRGASDAQFETELAQMNRSLAPEITTILLPAEAHLSTVSSSRLKELIDRGDDVAQYCPAAISARVRARLTSVTRGGEAA